jgi:hypothetical protein
MCLRAAIVAAQCLCLAHGRVVWTLGPRAALVFALCGRGPVRGRTLGAHASDLYRPDNFTWGYAGLPVQLPPPMETEQDKDENEKEWIGQNWHVSVAPRFDEAVYRRSDRCLPMYKISRVLDQFQRLYRLTPAEDWWGWSWYDDDTVAMTDSAVTSSSV